MNDVAKQMDANTQDQIDRLVAGELPENERGALVAWLDEDARRWRVCAVAFLEAQLWEQATAIQSPDRIQSPDQWSGCASVSPDHSSSRIVHRPAPLPPRLANHPDHWSGLWRMAIAASLLLAFCAGAGMARIWSAGAAPAEPQFVETSRPPTNDEATARDPDQPLLATVQVRTNLDPRVPMRLQLPVTTTADAAPRAPAMSDYERMQWERRGFEVKEEVRYLPARLPDGREVVVPVNSLRVEFKGTPVL